MGLGRIDLLNPLNDRHPLATGLAGFWLPLPNMAGGSKLFDLCNRRNDGTLANGPTWAAAENGFGAIGFDGVDDYIDCGTLPNVFSAGVTIRSRVYVGTPGADFRTILSARDGGPNTTPFSLDLDFKVSPGTARFYLNNGGFVIWQSTETVATGQWVTVEVGYTPGSTPRMWIDGRRATVTRTLGSSDPSILYTANSLRIGHFTAASGDDKSWIGKIAAVSLENIGSTVSAHDQYRRGFPDLLRRLPVRTPYEYVSGGGGTAVPVFLHHYRMMGAA